MSELVGLNIVQDGYLRPDVQPLLGRQIQGNFQFSVCTGTFYGSVW